MNLPAPVSAALADDLQTNPPIGPFFKAHYPQLEVRSLTCGAPDSATATLQRLQAQAALHWREPTLTHYALHELKLLPQRLHTFDVGLRRRFQVDVHKLQRPIRQITEAALRARSAQELDPYSRSDVPPELLQILIQPLLSQPPSAFEPYAPNNAATAWLAGLPQLLCRQLYATPQAHIEALEESITHTLKAATLQLFAELLSESKQWGTVCYPWPDEKGSTVWHSVDALITWRDELIIVDSELDAEHRLAAAANFTEYVAVLQRVLHHARPCLHFRRYLESAPAVLLYQREGAQRYSECARLKRTDFQRITHCAVSLNDMLAVALRLQSALVPRAEYTPLWVVSLHELAAHHVLLEETPLVFLYLRHRLHALRNPHLHYVSELDHIGMHHKDLAYAAALDTLSEIRAIVNHPYRQDFEHYFLRRLQA
jgi:hypothetical protein